jgi:hypothetical protein
LTTNGTVSATKSSRAPANDLAALLPLARASPPAAKVQFTARSNSRVAFSSNHYSAQYQVSPFVYMKPSRHFVVLFSAAIFAATAIPSVSAIQIIVEGGPGNVSLLGYSSLANMLSNTNPTTQPLSIAVGPGFGVTGFAADGSGYRMIVESSTGSILYLLSYSSLADMSNNTNPIIQLLTIPVGPTFNVSGFNITNSGGYDIMVDSGPGNVSLLSYSSLANMLTNTSPTTQPLSIAVGPGFGVTGFAADAGGYRMIVESSIGSDFYLLSYSSLADMSNNTSPTIQPFTMPVGPTFNVGGFDIQNQIAVPDSGTHVLPLIAFAGLAIMSRVLRGRFNGVCLLHVN